MEKYIREIRTTTLSIDLRSLAVLRIGLGLLILADLLIRGGDLSVWLSDDGVLPRDTVIDMSTLLFVWIPSGRWSLYFVSGSWFWSLLLFGLAGLAAIALILGFRTRWATLLSFVLLASLHNRAPIVLQSGDNLLLLLVCRTGSRQGDPCVKGGWFDQELGSMFSGLPWSPSHHHSKITYFLLCFSVHSLASF